jgi:hypothetical protein
MSTVRIAFVLILGLVVTAALVGPAHAQDADKPLFPAANPGNFLPGAENGTPIADNQQIWAYVAAVVGFIVVFAVAWFGVRIFAFLAILAAFFGGIALLCLAIRNRTVVTWEQLGFVVGYLGVVAGVTAITANLYLIKGGVSDKE